MRQFALAAVVLAAAVIALPAAARGFRVDANRCDDPDPQAIFRLECWEGVPSGANPWLPTQGDTDYISISDGLDSAKFETSSFVLIAFDYAKFMADNAAFFADPNNDISAPHKRVSNGLERPFGGFPFSASTDPVLRIYWFFDYDLYAAFPNIFSDRADFLDPNLDYFGVEVIFDLQGFKLYGLEPGGFAYARSSFQEGGNPSGSDDIWGPNQPCDRFDIKGVCVVGSVPEPSSVALLGLGFLALVVGLRTGKPARMHSV